MLIYLFIGRKKNHGQSSKTISQNARTTVSLYGSIEVWIALGSTHEIGRQSRVYLGVYSQDEQRVTFLLVVTLGEIIPCVNT